MTRNAAKPGGLDSDRRVSIALSLLGALDAAPDARIDARTFAHDLSLSDQQLNEIIQLLQFVEDGITGARVAIRREGNQIILDGDAGRFGTIRFTSDESLALMQVLDRFHIDDEVKGRIQTALAPSTWQTDQNLLAGDALFGGFYQDLCEAITDGVRLEIDYQPIDADTPSTRKVDPGYITVSGDAAYLVAWNVEKDEQRSYRLDRISRVFTTEDSVEKHPFECASVEEGLRAAGATADLAFLRQDLFDRCDWGGLNRSDTWIDEHGRIRAQVSYVSKSWLFDQVLAAGGSLKIITPAELRRELIEYARHM